MNFSENERCPLCGGRYTHIQQIKINAMGHITTVGPSGTKCETGKEQGRGTCITISFWGECGNTWDKIYQFRKGETLVETIVTEGLDSLEEAKELPRD